jgi:translocation and assembly module TamB
VIGIVIKYAVLALALVLLALVFATLWLTETSGGSRWLWERATPSIPGELRADSISGSIGDGFDLEGVLYLSEGVNVSVAKARLTAGFSLLPLTVELRELRAERVVVRLKETDAPEEPGEPILEKLALPFALDIRDVDVRELEVRNSADDRVLALHRAVLAGHWHEEIVVTRFAIESDAGDAEGTLRLGLGSPHQAEASLAGTYPLRLRGEVLEPVRITANAEGSLADLRIDVSSRGPELHVAGNLSDLLEEPGWDVRVDSPYFQWPLVLKPDQKPQVYLRDTVLESSGDLSGYAISAEGLVSVAGTEELQFQAEADGSLEGLAVTDLEVQGETLDAKSVGEVRWADGFSVAADAEIGHFDVSVLTEKWPSGHPVSGAVDAAWSAGNVRLNEVRLRVRDAATTVDATGEIDIDRGVVDLDLDWRDLRWPMAKPISDSDDDLDDTVRYISEFGQVNVSGSPDAWTFDGRIAFRTDALPQGVFVLSGSGDRDHAEALLSESEVLGGRASGQGSFNWAEDGRWSADLVTRNLDISPLAPELPGRISSDFKANGQLRPLTFDIDIDRLEGVLREKPLAGAGGIRYTDGKLRAQQLRLTSGESELRAHGSLESDAGLDFSLDVAALEMFVPQVAGSMTADGNVSTADGFPTARINLEAHDLHWRDYALQQLNVTSGAARADLPLSFDATGSTLSLGGREIRAFALQVAAGEERQRMALELSLADESLTIELDGGLDDWRRPLESVWTGQLVSFRFEAPDDVSFALAEPAGLRLSADRVALERSCLAGNTASRVCLEANWTGGADFDVAAEMEAVPVNLVRAFYETDLEFTQTLSGSWGLRSNSEQALSGEGQIDISPGRIESPAETRIATRTGAGRIRFNLSDGQLLAGRLTLPFSDSAEIDALFEAQDISMGAASPVEGRLLVNLNDLGVATNALPMIEEAHGRLDVDVSIAGTLGAPLFTGDASLSNGAFRYEPLGLAISDIELDTVIRDDNEVELQSTFRAGSGTGELRSTAWSLNGAGGGLSLSLTGENLTVIDLPDVNVVADTDLAVGIRKEGLTINGNVLIPKARLTPTDLTSTTKISESDDVVIVANGEDEAVAANGDTAPFEIEGTVALVLGDDVVVDLDVAEARVSGTSTFHWNGPHIPVATGQYNVRGRFQAYGQLLDITEGTIRFPGVPASSPNLRIRAEREIFGNPQIRSAGVLVTGTPQEPVVDVYTTPATTGDRAVTLLVTGSDFDYEQGVGAVDVGTYVAPDLFVSYGIGLFERGNVISIRYDIAKGFGIKATSGNNTEGVDLSYTLER